MNYIEARVTFDHPEPQQAADLIAGVFFDFELQGVVVEDPSFEPEEEWAEDAVARPEAPAVIGYLPADGRLDARRLRLEAEIARLGNHIGLVHRVSYRQVGEQDWAESWKAFFQPQKIGERIVVKPSWREYGAQPGELVLEIDPGMAFGTGAHPTTALCVQLLERHLKTDDAFLDIGTGSGILLLAAAMLGAGRLCGGDSDEMAVRVAAENLRRNGIDGRRACLVLGSLGAPFRGRFDVVAANILTQIVVELLDDAGRLLKPGGLFICSGIIEPNRELVAGKMRDAGFEVLEIRQKEGWVAMAGKCKRRVHGWGS